MARRCPLLRRHLQQVHQQAPPPFAAAVGSGRQSSNSSMRRVRVELVDLGRRCRPKHRIPSRWSPAGRSAAGGHRARCAGVASRSTSSWRAIGQACAQRLLHIGELAEGLVDQQRQSMRWRSAGLQTNRRAPLARMVMASSSATPASRPGAAVIRPAAPAWVVDQGASQGRRPGRTTAGTSCARSAVSGRARQPAPPQPRSQVAASDGACRNRSRRTARRRPCRARGAHQAQHALAQRGLIWSQQRRAGGQSRRRVAGLGRPHGRSHSGQPHQPQVAPACRASVAGVDWRSRSPGRSPAIVNADAQGHRRNSGTGDSNGRASSVMHGSRCRA